MARAKRRLRIRTTDHDVLQELIEEELLDENILSQIPTFTVPGGNRELLFNEAEQEYEWQPSPRRDLDCRAVACEFTPDAPNCD